MRRAEMLRFDILSSCRRSRLDMEPTASTALPWRSLLPIRYSRAEGTVSHAGTLILPGESAIRRNAVSAHNLSSQERAARNRQD
jgi:hypothetical protein